MKQGVLIVIILWSIFYNPIYAQSNELFSAESRMLIQSEDATRKSFEAYTETADMTLSLSTGDLLVTATLSDAKTDDASIDSLIKSKGQQTFTFKGKMSQDNLYIFTQHVNDEKDYFIEGQLTINSKTIPCVATFNPTNFSEKNDNKKFRMTFELVVNPTKITILGLEEKINNQLIFKIINGPLNTQP